jgi:hypothetical protein
MTRAAIPKKIDASGEPTLVRELAARLVDDAHLQNIVCGKEGDDDDEQATLKYGQAVPEAVKDIWPEATLGDVMRAQALLDAATAFLGN